MSRFSSILVANRGEIACRIMRTARALGYPCVALFTDADAGSPHVQMADQAVNIGSGPVADSYLNADRVLAAAQSSGAQAIHPGYGFLSENAEFAARCADAGLVFIGPDPQAIAIMGNKAEAKRRMLAAKVPCVPGYHGEDQSDAMLAEQADRIGFPVMVKAAAGGGGRGMRLVHQSADLDAALARARSEAEQAFGSGELILEKAIERPRHVEIQIFADRSGHTIHLGERDCSIQRRHQKVLEEAPCPALSVQQRAEMGQAAVTAARSVNYCGAGTVEFLLDSDGAFYFLEMNTRLQVEHPVTEMVTGLDLVALQIEVAQGRPLDLTQDQVSLSGHAMEARLYAEDPAQQFLPAAGSVVLWCPPGGSGVRVDAGVTTGQVISPYYDAMIAKIVSYGPTREVARDRLLRALADTVVFGITSNRQFLVRCLQKQTFVDAAATTGFIEEEFDQLELAPSTPPFIDTAIAATVDVAHEHSVLAAAALQAPPELFHFSSADVLEAHRRYDFAGTVRDVTVRSGSLAGAIGRYHVTDGEDSAVVELLRMTDAVATFTVAGNQGHCNRGQAFFRSLGGGRLYLQFEGRCALFENQLAWAGPAESPVGGGRIAAPMHGLVTEVMVQAGDRVDKGQRLLVIEAMKMQHQIHAHAAGRVASVRVAAGDQVAADVLLVEIDPASSGGGPS